ncbi:hypothetical protein [Nocardia sp. NPDC050710]|uniref:hypothetical protein n=1 Tax=Nocardia sp. NPDC050710 TaxID=3157220 RepID=UPI0033C08D72
MSTVTVAVVTGFPCCALIIRAFAVKGAARVPAPGRGGARMRPVRRMGFMRADV